MNKKALIRTVSQELAPSVPQDKIALILDKGRFLQSKNGTRFIATSNLSSALSAVRNNMGAAAYSIKKAIGQLER